MASCWCCRSTAASTGWSGEEYRDLVTDSAWKVDFICIGAMKAGTTWIHGILDEHPEVCMGLGKEVHFFDDEHAYAQGLDHYRSFFRHSENGQLLGEVTPRYIHMPSVPGRIHQHFPRTKLIASLRNPVDRAWSQYRFDCHQGGRMSFYESFEDAVERDHDLVSRGRYAEQLSRYYELFPREKILVLRFEDIQTVGPGVMARRLFEFLELDDLDFSPPSLLRRKNVTGKKRAQHRAPWLHKALYSGRARLRKFRRLEAAVVRSGLEAFFRRLSMANRKWVRGEPEVSSMQPETRERLQEIYRDDIRQLESLTGMSFEKWTV